MLEDDFVLVSYRRPFKIKPRKSKSPIPFEDDIETDCDSLLGKLIELENEIKNSPFGDSLFAKLKESLTTLKVDAFTRVLCYGLGCFFKSRAPKYQLALLKYLKERYNAEVYIYDPSFKPKEIEFLEKLNFQVIDRNEEGKRTVNDKPTLVFLPHCPHYLTNNFLYANWTRDLCNCVLMGNSISSVIPLSRFQFHKAFNSTSIHIFPEENLNALPDEFWANREEPKYKLTDEMITAEETKGLLSNDDNIKMSTNLQIIRSLIKEIRHGTRDGKVKDNIMVQYVLEQARGHRETSEVLCKEREELRNLAETYNCYLTSARQCKEINKRYAGKGERSIKETANLVGFKLPHDPK